MNRTRLKSSIMLLGLVAFCLLSCNKSIDNIKDYYKYINSPSSGLVKMKNIGNISFSMKYIPSDFYLYKACKEFPNISKDSLKKEYENSFNFILKIGPSEAADVKFDIMTETVSSLAEFQEQVLTVNFGLQKFIRLKMGNREIAPVLVETENVYGLTQHRLINVVFAKEEFEEDWTNNNEIDITFNDEIYGTGKHHFLFYKKDLNNIPELDITK